MKKQTEICDYLVKNKYKGMLDKKIAQNAIRQAEQNFLIGNEIRRENEPARYFKIFFEEIRTDQEFVQITPMVCFKEGCVKVDQNGNISLTDNEFNPYRSSKNFNFDQGKLITSDNWNIVEEERYSSTCVKRLLSFGLFAVVAGAAYYAATNSDSFVLKI
jgi:hypothetical protein